MPPVSCGILLRGYWKCERDRYSICGRSRFCAYPPYLFQGNATLVTIVPEVHLNPPNIRVLRAISPLLVLVRCRLACPDSITVGRFLGSRFVSLNPPKQASTSRVPVLHVQLVFIVRLMEWPRLKTQLVPAAIIVRYRQQILFDALPVITFIRHCHLFDFMVDLINYRNIFSK